MGTREGVPKKREAQEVDADGHKVYREGAGLESLSYTRINESLSISVVDSLTQPSIGEIVVIIFAGVRLRMVVNFVDSWPEHKAFYISGSRIKEGGS